jgi:hypothetical protein
VSLLTEAVIYVGSMDEHLIGPTLDAPLSQFNDQKFNRLDSDLAGGGKFACGGVWWACFNYANPDTLTEWFRSLPWQAPEYAVLVIDYEHEEQLLIVRAKAPDGS